MFYVLKLCSWFPSKIDELSGDFVQRHALSISTQTEVVVLFAIKDETRHHGGIEVQLKKRGKLTEYVCYYPQKKLLDKWWSQFYYLKILRKILPMLIAEKGEPGLVHVNIAWKAAIWAAYIRRRYPWPFVITENSTEYQAAAKLNIRTVGVFRQKLTAQLFKSARMFIPVSNQLGQLIQQLYGKIPFSVVPNAVDTAVFHPIEQIGNAPFTILHISTLTYQKNPEGLFRVFDQLAQKHTNLRIQIIGPNQEPFLNLIDAEPYRKNAIHLLGTKSYSEVAKYVQAADLLVLFSRYENLPCVILEAHCCGVPVVSTNVGGIAEVIDNSNGILVENEAEEDFKRAIELVINGEITFNKDIIAKKAMEKYNYDSVGKAFMNAYQQAGINIKQS